MDNEGEVDFAAEDELDVVLSLDPEVQAVLDELLPSDDPLDKVDFNEIEYINQLFPTEQSLANLDDVIGKANSRIRELDTEIRGVLHAQNDASQEAKQVLDDAQSVIGQLFARLNEIREKADRSENAVREITSDIRQLDNAKRNLTSSITTLNQLYVLVGEFELLEKLTRKRQYGEVAIHLAGAHDVLGNLERFMHIPYVSELVQRISSIESELKTQIFTEFRDAFEFQRAKAQAGKAGQQTTLFCACRVVDLLPKSAKSELVTWFVKLQLAEYGVLFNESQDDAWLDKIDRRYTFCKKLLKDIDEKFAEVFPAEWEICESIAVEFCEVTRSELARMMQKRVGDIDVKLLLFAIQKTSAFESLMGKIFTGVTLRPPAPLPATAGSTADRKRTASQLPAAKASKNPFETAQSPDSQSKNPFEAEAEAEAAAAQGEAAEAHEAKKGDAAKSPFLGLISRCFEPHLGIYIDAQEKNLAELIVRFAADFSATTANTNAQNGDGSAFADTATSSNKVHPSCADLFMFFKKALLQLSAISNGEAMLQLTRVFQKSIRDYATRVLLAGLPLRRPAGGSNLVDESSRMLQKLTSAVLNSSFVQSNLRELNIQVGQLAAAGAAKDGAGEQPVATATQSMDSVADLTPFLPTNKLNDDELARVCCVICTAEYCSETVSQLESKLRERTETKLRERVSFGSELELLQTVISACIQILVHDLESCCEPALSAMSKLAWSTVDSVGDQSNYVSVIATHLRTNLVIIRENLALSRKYFTQFCLKFAGSFVNRFIQSLFKCKPISLVGAEQLLLDTHSLKTVLMDLPSVGSAITLRKPPSSYTKVVHQLMTKAEMVLKSVMAPLNPPQTYVADFVKLLPDSDLADFTKVLEMKGVVKKQEQAVYVDLFRSFQAGAQQRAANASQTNANTALETNTNAGQLVPQHSRTDTASAKDSNAGLSSSLKTLPQAAGAKTLSSFPESSANDKEELSSSRISIKNLEKLIKRK